MQTKAATIRILTLGCAKNKVDSEVLFSQLKAQGMSVQHSQGEASERDTLVINTCGFIESAKEQSLQAILEAVEAKRQGHLERLFVMGCLSARYKDSLREEIPEVDAYFGAQSWAEVLRAVGKTYRESLLSERHTSTPAHYAYMKISEGCDRPCTFCAIPGMRGAHRSRPMEELVKEARYLVSNGVKELILVAQDSTYYGLDLYGKRVLAELMDQLADIQGLHWIRLHYAYPNGFPLDVLEVMARRKNICKYLDMPLQHASSKVLRNMRRPMDLPKLRHLLSTIRSRVPEIALRTTFMVGFPGETEADFEALLHFVKEQRFERLGGFTYSHEEGTEAHTRYKDDVPAPLKRARYDRLMQLQRTISLERNKSLIGTRAMVLVEAKKEGIYVGRSAQDSPDVDNQVLIESKQALLIGDFVETYIERAGAYDLYANVRHP